MSTIHRIVASVPPELEGSLRKLKQEQYYDKPMSEMVRHLIVEGLKASNISPPPSDPPAST